MQLAENDLLHLIIEALMLKPDWRDVFLVRPEAVEALTKLDIRGANWNRVCTRVLIELRADV